MKEICIPIPHFGDQQIAEVEVTVNGKKKKYNFRVESFPWLLEEEELTGTFSETQIKIEHLRKMLDEYDDTWELVQIFTPRDGSTHIQVLFRQRTPEPVS
ncbi:MAG: hypothetical protein JW995_03980 [Melioribacteraceae bacterium]|nr:hypothetical protein [Melioribacteraceae bacterium]